MVSVIVPTYNGAHKILRILKSLEKQSFKDFETLIVVDGSTDDTLELLNSSTFSLKSVRIISQKNSGRAIVRNRGAKEAKGDLLVFFDDDMRPEKDCVETHVTHHIHFPGSISVGSVVNDYRNATTEMQRYKCYYSRKWEENLEAFNDKPLPKDKLYITAANFSISKNIFQLLKGFDERLNDAEDHDLAIRAYLSATPIYYKRDAFAWHDEQFTIQSYIQRRKGYNEAQEKLKIYKPEIYTVFKHRTIHKKGIIKSLFFWLFSSNYWVFLIDRFSFFSFLPQRIRFILYDWVITSKVLYFPKS